ncbi:protein NUCLEAR FUSION DEFECTIVE 2 [Cornus florida]|uniref:protein NUCLEAR FUSION DEFECTIVE 2 n=1 Tax=Cornus florida TaxID=4283 RepID=UPI0028A1FAB0|nr:protein NUCLEAR FUSION DEFECTIVE 2 [Cornus florida]
MHSRQFLPFVFLAFAIYLSFQALAQEHSAKPLHDHTFKPSSTFSLALETLQKQIGYTFQSVGLLRRAMTHASYSEENNKALSILGANVIDTSIALRSLGKDIEISPKDLNRRISEIAKVESSCAVDGTRLGLQKIVRVSPKTNSTSPALVCGTFRAIFGAIAVDTGKSDEAGNVFWSVHGGDFARAFTL